MSSLNLPELFTGNDGQDFDVWLQNFERATGSDPEAISLRHIFLRSCISESAFDSWITLSSSDKCNYESAKLKLTAVFGRQRVPFSDLSSPTSHNPDHSPPTISDDWSALFRQILQRLDDIERKADEWRQLPPSCSCSMSHPNLSKQPSHPSERNTVQTSMPTQTTPHPTSFSSVGTQTTNELDQTRTHRSVSSVSLHTYPAMPSAYPDDLSTRILQFQQQDEEIEQVKQLVASHQKLTPKLIQRFHPRIRRYLWQLPRFTVRNGILYRTKMDMKTKSIVHQAVIPESLTPHVLSLIHNHPMSGHFNIQQTLDRAKSEMFWPFMHRDIVNFCESCDCYQPAIFCQQAPSQSLLSSYQPQKVYDDARNHKKAGSKFSSRHLSKSNGKNSHPRRSEVEQLAGTAHPFFGNPPNFEYPPFFPLSSSHPPSWMGGQGTINSDTRLQTTRHYLDASFVGPDDYNPDDCIVESEGSSSILGGPPGPFPSTNGQRTR